MGGLVNPILQELNGLSPSAKSALMAAHGAATATQPPPAQGMQPPSPAMASILAQTAPQGPAPAPMLLPPSQTPAVPAMTSSAPAVKAPRGTLEGDQAHRSDLMASKPGLENVYSKISNSGFGQAHPMAGKILGGLAQIPSTIADIALTSHPNIGGLIPGTTAQHGLDLARTNKAITADQGERTQDLQNQETQARIPFTLAQTEHERAATDALKNPEPKPKEEHWTVSPEYTGPNGEPVEVEQNSGEMRIAGQPGSGFKRAAPKGDRPDTPEQQFIDEFTKTHPGAGIAEAVRAYAATTQKPERSQRALMMIPDGKGGYTATEVSPGQTIAPGAVTAAGLSGSNAAASKETTKEQKAAKSLVDNAETAHALAKEAEAGNAPADVDLALAFFKTIKGADGSGIRFTQQEQNLIRGSRAASGDLEAMAQKVIGGGQMFTTDQRNKILRVIDLHAEQARNHLGDSASPTGSPAGGAFKVNLKDAMALPQNKGKSESEVEADVKKHGGEVVR